MGLKEKDIKKEELESRDLDANCISAPISALCSQLMAGKRAVRASDHYLLTLK